MKNKSFIQKGLMVAGAAVAGFALYKLSQKENREKFAKKSKKLKKAVDKRDFDAVSKEILGKDTAELQAELTKTVSNFSERVSEMVAAGKSIDTQKYKRAVDDLVKSLESDKVFTKVQIKKLKKYLESDYKFVTEK